MNKSKMLPIAGIVIGGILSLSPMFGLLGTVIGMNHAFAVLGASGVSDPRKLSDSIGHVLMFTASGLFIFPLGILILVVSIIFLVKAPRPEPPPLPTN